MSELTVGDAIDNIYAALRADNKDLDLHIAALKSALARAGQADAVFDPKKLAQNNRSGRKLMQSYFAKRGVKVAFAARKAEPAQLA